MKKHSKPASVEVEHIETGNKQTLTLEEATRLFRIEAKNGFNNWKLPAHSKYGIVNGFILRTDTATNQRTEDPSAIAEGAEG